TITPSPTPTETPTPPAGCDNPLPADPGTTWNSLDINGAMSGYTGSAGGAVYVCGSGGGIGGAMDAFRYVYRVVSSPNVELIARVSNWNGGANSAAQGGLMIRNATAPNSAHGAGVLIGSGGLSKLWRTGDGEGTSEASGGTASTPVWLRLLKIGNTLVAYRSANGSSWTRVGGLDTVSLGGTYLVGMAVSAHTNGQYAYATFDSISVNTSPAPVTIASEGFESGNISGGMGWSGSWSLSGNAAVTTQGSPRTGSYHLRLLSNDGAAARAVDMSGVLNPRLQFSWKADSFEGQEYALVEIYDGSTWRQLLRVDNGQDDNIYHSEDIDLSSYTMTSSLQLRFRSQMSGTNDYFYVDDVVITGYR
ncbi:MAG: hypothetical protein ACP5R2_02010, partial [Anaerolineae bacterium]